MFNNDYEEYMRSVLGYPAQNSYDENQYTYNNSYFPYKNVINNYKYDDLYPEIYTILDPMIKKICMNFPGDFNKDVLNQMSMEIYNNIEADMNIVNINISTDSREKDNNKNLYRVL